MGDLAAVSFAFFARDTVLVFFAAALVEARLDVLAGVSFIASELLAFLALGEALGWVADPGFFFDAFGADDVLVLAGVAGAAFALVVFLGAAGFSTFVFGFLPVAGRFDSVADFFAALLVFLAMFCSVQIAEFEAFCNLSGRLGSTDFRQPEFSADEDLLQIRAGWIERSQ